VYTKTIPYKDYKGNPRNEEINLNLDEREVFKLLDKFQIIMNWRESIKGPERDLSTEEVITFYTAFEEILLESWGVPSEDGRLFDKTDRYQFESSKLFNATMVHLVSNPTEVDKVLEKIMPEGMQELVAKADENTKQLLAKSDVDEDLRVQLQRLQKQIEEQSQKS
jgi:hypothetical protein